jgi:ParB-like chromosome segregation protein Spo0J
VEQAVKIGQYDTHEAADIFPLLDAHGLTGLRDDIAAHGLRVPIVLYQGKILDGRNRLRACIDAKVEPRFIDFDGNDEDALGFVVSMNMARRDLDDGQRALAARRLVKLHARLVTKARKAKPPTLPGVSADCAEMAATLEVNGVDELVAAVDRGDVPLHAAAAVAQLDDDQQRAVLAEVARIEQPDPVRARSESVEVTSKVISLNPKSVAALRALALLGDKSIHMEAREGARVLRMIVEVGV